MTPDVEGVIDFHTHIDEFTALGWIDPPEKLIPLLDEAHVDIAVAMTYRDASAGDRGGLDYLLTAVAAYPDRLRGLARLRPSQDQSSTELLREAVEDHGLAGLKLHPVSTFAPPWEAPTVNLVNAASELGVPVLIHCGDEPFTTPLAMEQLARRAPSATIILAHMGGYRHGEEAIEVSRRCPGILLETSATPYPALIRSAVETIGADRVVFGSDAPGAPPRIELAKVLSAGLLDRDLQRVLRDNALRLLGKAR